MIKNKKRKIGLLSIAMSCIVLCANVSGSVEEIKSLTLENEVAYDTSGSVHIFNKTETNDFIVTNNTSEYVVVIPRDLAQYDKLASQEFVYFFELGTGVKLTVKYDDEVADFSENSKIISIGYTKHLGQSGVSCGFDLKQSGFVIKTVGKSIFVAGSGDWTGNGNLYGTYELLAQLLNYDYFGHNAYHVDTVNNLKLYNFDIIDIPDFDKRKCLTDDSSDHYDQRMRTQPWNDLFMSVPGYGQGHNCFGFVHPDDYAYPDRYRDITDGVTTIIKDTNPNYRPDWFVWEDDVPKQLNLTANDMNAETIDQEMLDRAAESLIAIAAEQPNYNQVIFSFNDDPVYAASDKAYAARKYNGNFSGMFVEFCNGLSTRVKKYYADNNIDREIDIYFYAYVQTENPPVDVAGNPLILAEENVGAMYCPIFQDEAESLVAPDNSDAKSDIENWQKVCTMPIDLWLYNACFYDFMYPRFAMNGIAENVRYSHSIGVDMFFVEGQTYNPVLWTFGELENYLYSKLMWDISLDQTELTERWFKYYYQDAWEPMKEVFDLIQANYNYWNHKDSLHMGTDGSDFQTAKVWPLGFLKQLCSKVEDALEIAKISYETTDNALYEKLYKRILIEKVSFDYGIIQWHSSSFTSADILAMKKQMKKDCVKIGCALGFEGQNMTVLWERWGI